jgi:hypothetical protein
MASVMSPYSGGVAWKSATPVRELPRRLCGGEAPQQRRDAHYVEVRVRHAELLPELRPRPQLLRPATTACSCSH